MKNRNDYTRYYNVGNLICFLIMYIASVILLFKYVENIFLRIIGMLLLYYFCGQLELRVMVRIVNPLVMLFMPADVRRKEWKDWKEIRIRERQEFKDKLY